MIRKKKEKISIEFEVEYDEVEWNGRYIPKTVYKYRDWDNPNHKKMLEELSIWVPDSYDFNDPFDCDIPIAYDLLLNDKILAEKFIRKIIDNNKHRYGENVELAVQKRLKEQKYKDPSFIKEYKEEIHKSIRGKTGIFSVTPVNDNILMWSHYANSHKGICIGFDSTKLFESIRGAGGNVNYTKEYPIISPIDTHEKQYMYQVFTKSEHWAYEVEYRLTTFPHKNVSIPISPDVITEIILGANMEPNNKTNIKHLITKKLPHVKCFSAIPDKNSFKVNIVPEQL